MPGVKRPYCQMEEEAPSLADKKRVKSSRAVRMDFFGKLLEGSFSNLAEVGKVVSQHRVNAVLKSKKRVTCENMSEVSTVCDLTGRRSPEKSFICRTSTPKILGQCNPSESLTATNINLLKSTVDERISSSLRTGKREFSCLLDSGLETNSKKRKSRRRATSPGPPRERREAIPDHIFEIPVSLEDIFSEQCYEVDDENFGDETVVFLKPVERI